MAKDTFTAEVLTPEGSVFKDEVEMVSTRTTVGSIGILAKHQPLLGMLEPTELRLYKSESEIIRFAQGEGYVQVSRDGVLLLVEEALDPEFAGHLGPRGPPPQGRGGRAGGGRGLRGAPPGAARPAAVGGVPQDRGRLRRLGSSTPARLRCGPAAGTAGPEGVPAGEISLRIEGTPPLVPRPTPSALGDAVGPRGAPSHVEQGEGRPGGDAEPAALSAGGATPPATGRRACSLGGSG